MFYHIIDHNGFGTMHKLITPLCKEGSIHKIVSYDNIYELKNIMQDKQAHIIIHSTASKKSNFIHEFLNYFKDRPVYIFMHVSVNYELYKGRGDVIEYLKYLTDNYPVTVLTPSKEVTNQYRNCGVKAKTIQLGIDMGNKELYYADNSLLAPYYNRIITTCSSDNDEYKYIKGIDLYERFIFDNNLLDLSLVAGTDNSRNTRITCKRFEEKDFLNILAHSLMYVQFSRFESYNITASYAKLLRKPVLLLNTEGSYSCMNGLVYDYVNALTREALNILRRGPDNKLICNLYNDSLRKESIENFSSEFQKVIGGR